MKGCCVQTKPQSVLVCFWVVCFLSDMVWVLSILPLWSVGWRQGSLHLLNYNKYVLSKQFFIQVLASNCCLKCSVMFFCGSWGSLWSSMKQQGLALPPWLWSRPWRGPELTSNGCNRTSRRSGTGSTVRLDIRFTKILGAMTHLPYANCCFFLTLNNKPINTTKTWSSYQESSTCHKKYKEHYATICQVKPDNL